MKNLLLLLTLLTSSVYANSLTKEEFKKAMGFFNGENDCFPGTDIQFRVCVLIQGERRRLSDC